jgi:hypothetical protein
MDAVRVRSVEVWALNTGVSTPTTISLSDESNGYTGGPTRTVTDTQLGTTAPAHIKWFPAKGSMQDQWMTTGGPNNSLVFLSLNGNSAGVILDLVFDYVIGDGTDAPVSGPAFAGAGATGQIYFRKFGLSSGSSPLIPQAVQYAA